MLSLGLSKDVRKELNAIRLMAAEVNSYKMQAKVLGRICDLLEVLHCTTDPIENFPFGGYNKPEEDNVMPPIKTAHQIIMERKPDSELKTEE
jgi:hypothetical protein